MSKGKTAETPLMQQHNAIKQKYPDAVLLFRVGDFYETFGGDAIIASQVLGITLTKRNNGTADNELAGFPYHALDTYLHKLVKAGYRVAICDQLEDPKAAKGIVKRGVTEMVTPGTATNDKLLDHGTNNFLAALHYNGTDRYGMAFLDISTGEFLIAEGDQEAADKLLSGFKPAEVIFQRQYQKRFKETFAGKYYTYTLDEWIFQEHYAHELLLKQFNTHSLKGFGVESLSLGQVAAGAVLHYLKETEHPNLQHITSMQRIDQADYLWMDRFTIRNLELLGGGYDGGNSLLTVLDNTATPMGARMLKRWIVFPLKDLGRINERLDLVEHLILQTELRQHLVQAMKLCGDMERLVSKIPLKKINPRELLQLARSLKQVDIIKHACAQSSNAYLQRLSDALNPCLSIAGKIISEVMENPPAVAAKGGFIQNGVHTELDGLRAIATNGKEYLLQMQQQEADRTGISSLKVGFNNVFGYFLEVTNSHKSKVPPEWIRKQTLANAERYITPELKDYEEKITGAEEKILAIEMQLFEGLVNELQDFLSCIQANAQVVATLDCICCFAQNALQFNYKKPEVHNGEDLTISEGRHPVIERTLPPGDVYVSNDLKFNKEDQQIIILTGPNMSGKSALLRQTAIITLMAHMGSFVPAVAAHIPLTDKIFTRVGASDNLNAGESTFMVEMNETASIINNISPRCLILLDEIGRGTSTYDGISIAWSIVEYLHHSPHQPKTFFATHYHELNELENKLARVRNFHVTNKEIGGKIIFLRKLAEGGSTHSFGIHVARMAGMPPELINRANEVLTQLEQKHESNDNRQNLQALSGQRMQLNIFDTHSQTFDEIRNALNNVDINRLTPVEALLKLNEIKGMIK
ncbi:DNA mismatch repair protein MutS [Cnuella takakiae]|uniref:DNA mismatch repair protein MutS n=1 Tax=Cnuella takakiae TaxID=1302690 RepID=A0A1M4VJ30_9BACT|nr:DNA mismatch repair protein MutS [Cnuella takakiae]OLY92584.1 DNA mismatch repair protein MutS [Cnuella takakiae]SHE68873.1 DNA mismatch repair protein MutS [Cnuella takakiae]